MTSSYEMAWLTYIDSIRHAPDFDAAAHGLLNAASDVVHQTLSKGTFQPAQLLDMSLHLRSDEGYHALVGYARQSAADRPPDRLQSASLWQRLTTWRASFYIDVLQGLLSRVTSPEHALELDLIELHQNTTQSMRRLLDSEATHIVVLPIFDTRDHTAGMLIVELQCHAAIGRPFPWTEGLQTLHALLTATSPYLLAKEHTTDHPVSADPLLPVIGQRMAPLITMLSGFAKTDEVILLSGPTGAGKSQLAKWCHTHSARAKKPFITLDFLSIPEDMQMAHLVGWRRGAFTDAARDVPGALTRAEGGTLFIDEIDKVSLATQAGLLRLLEERTYQVLGDVGGERQANVRFIVGTNVSLREAVSQGTFREDLYYRLHVLPLVIPPLRERRDEISAWAAYMAGRCANREPRPLDIACQTLLRYQDWPGNLRQLDNVIRRAWALACADASTDIQLPHIQHALALEQTLDPSPEPLELLLHRSAEALVERSLARGGISFKLVDAFRAFVLEAASARLGSVPAAFEHFGQENLVRNRNHQAAWRRELKRRDDLIQALSQPTD